MPQDKLVKIPVPSKEADALLAKARAIIDWLDVRTMIAERPSQNDLNKAEAKFGSVTLTLAAPVQIETYEFESSLVKYRATRGQGGYWLDLKCRLIDCKEIIVMEYSNYLPPVVLVRDIHNTNYMYDKLNRRTQEQTGVVKYGLPGRSPSDTAYYKKPEVLFRELQELMKKPNL